MRCVAWWTNSVVLVGCLDGRVHECEVGGATKEVLHLEGSVLHMQFSHQFKVGFVYEKSHTYTRCNFVHDLSYT